MKKITFIRFLTLLTLLFTVITGFSQTVGLPQISGCSYSGCNAGDLTITKAYIALDNNVPLTSCTAGTTVNAFLYIHVNTGPKYNIYVQFDLYNGATKVNGINKFTYAEPVTGTLIPNTPIKIAPITFTCGDELELKNIYVSWKTGGASSNPASCAGVGGAGSKCADASAIPNIPVNTPISPNFTYSKSCDGDSYEKVVFTNTSTGGDGTKAYSWNFGAGASPATANTVGPHTVTYSSGGSKMVSLTVTDADNDMATKTTSVTVLSCCNLSITNISSTNVSCFEGNNGTVTATISGAAGTPVYDLLYSSTSGGVYSNAGLPTNGDANGIYSGLSKGFYKVNVVDDNNCNVTSNYVEVTQPAAAVVVSGTQTNVLCNGGSTGAIDLSVVGGSG
ncbi:SprB repeat-containing protein, partial [Lutibacter maritimus]